MSATAMFPLNSVLLPHTPIALRIFEPRYLVMLGRMLDEEEPEFGVVLIERGHEAGGGDGRSMIGTMARIVQVEVGAEDMHLVAVGDERISVDRWLEDDPYPQAEVHALPRLEWDDALTPLRAEAERAVRRVLARAAEYGSVLWDPSTELSDDPVASAWQLAGIAPLGEFDRFRLLRSTTMGGLLRQTLDLTLDVEPLLTAPPLEDDDDQP
ncbi:LON peptidase substrate-binding domain-containing protein [Microbacterium sp. RU33B]|uniref:LON peptidase substrate-binding domain-containing protein n=1 Tax=Microbacterium sp. RU33B TaxID=1907390 RepID=UPI00095BBCE3|nr:LON peptidase substrate-binding domain-containing protein [Microbacterium sp. RU33B]SIT72935.1 hypothetical protein SAMN05880545_1132 [Microbacterium sp. RU33B]